MPLKLPRFQQNERIIDEKGCFTPLALMRFQQRDKAIEDAFAAQQDAIEAIAAAQAAADAANTAAANAQTAADTANGAAEAVTAESALVNSYVTNFTPPLVSADSAGNVTIGNHDRVYGDGTTVAVTGAVVATALTNPAVARIYYDDAARSGGAVSYQFTISEATAAQTGDRHSVGAVEIPAAGTVSGGYVKPPGWTDYQ